MPIIYVASDRPGAGRTTFVAALAQLLRQAGRDVVVAKPFAIGASSGRDNDFYAKVGLAPAAADVPVPTLERVRDAARSLQALAGANRTVVVEGLPLVDTAGLAVPGATQLPEALDARVVLVIQQRPGLDAVQVTATARAVGSRLAGVVLNGRTKHRGHATSSHLVPGIEAQGARVLGVVPEDRTLLAVTVAQVAQRLEAKWLLHEEHGNKLVEHFLMGGFMLDWGRIYFGRLSHKAVICRHDRPDIQMAALRSGTPTSALVLTAGQETFNYDFPVQYVRHEALWLEVPVLLSRKNTVDTATALDGITGEARFDHPRKLERAQELLRAHVDLSSLGVPAGTLRAVQAG